MNDSGDLLLVFAREQRSRAGLYFRTYTQVRAASGAWSDPVRIAGAPPDQVAIGPGNVAVTYVYPARLSSVDDTVRGVSGTSRGVG